MTNELHIALHNWWDALSFEGKESYLLNDAGVLFIKIGDHPQRVIAELHKQDADAIFTALITKYETEAAKFKELEAEWEQTEDKLKLGHKVEKTKEALLKLDAVGAINILLTKADAWIEALHKLSENNYSQKLQLAEKAEALTESTNWKETSQAYKDITEAWKQSGYLDRKRTDALWSRIEIAKNKFYTRKRQHQEENEKELLQNLDLKMELVDKAEGLTNSEKWKETSEAYKQLMEQWKGIGPTLHEKNEELWNRFIAAKNNFFDRKKAHTESIHKEHDANLHAKVALVEKAEALKDSTDWGPTTQAFANIMEAWKNTGRAEAEKADALWARMKAAREHFFSTKQKHFGEIKESLLANYEKKKGLLARAEALQDSTHWHDATDEMNELMDEWKKLGPVPREHSNKIWEAFLTARKTFFKRKDENRERRKEHAEKKKQAEAHHAKDLVKRLEREIREEEERIADFKNGLENITPGKKEKELREHLHTLIAEGEEKIKHKQLKIQQAQKDLEQVELATKAKSNKKEVE